MKFKAREFFREPLLTKSYLKYHFKLIMYRVVFGYASVGPFSYLRLYIDLNFTSTSLFRPKLYFNLYFSTNNKSRFAKRSKYICRSTRAQVKVEVQKRSNWCVPVFFIWQATEVHYNLKLIPKKYKNIFKDFLLSAPRYLNRIPILERNFDL